MIYHQHKLPSSHPHQHHHHHHHHHPFYIIIIIIIIIINIIIIFISMNSPGPLRYIQLPHFLREACRECNGRRCRFLGYAAPTQAVPMLCAGSSVLHEQGTSLVGRQGSDKVSRLHLRLWLRCLTAGRSLLLSRILLLLCRPYCVCITIMHFTVVMHNHYAYYCILVLLRMLLFLCIIIMRIVYAYYAH